MTSPSDLRSLMAAASPLPWTAKHLTTAGGNFPDFHCVQADPNEAMVCRSPGTGVRSSANVDLIAAACNALPGHLERIAELEAALKDPRIAEMRRERDDVIAVSLALAERLKLDEEHRMRNGNYAAGHAAGMKAARNVEAAQPPGDKEPT